MTPAVAKLEALAARTTEAAKTVATDDGIAQFHGIRFEATSDHEPVLGEPLVAGVGQWGRSAARIRVSPLSQVLPAGGHPIHEEQEQLRVVTVGVQVQQEEVQRQLFHLSLPGPESLGSANGVFRQVQSLAPEKIQKIQKYLLVKIHEN